MPITLRQTKGSALTIAEADSNISTLDLRTKTGWRDMLAPISTARIPAANAPTMRPFGPSGTREEYSFDVNDYCWLQAFHVNHDMLQNSEAYLHVHWSTNGVNTAVVKWQFEVLQAIGHNQANFGAPAVMTVQQACHGSAWRHMISEIALADVLTIHEPDELLLVTLKRVTNGGTDNTDYVFGVTADIHYQSDRHTTPNKAPDFYV